MEVNPKCPVCKKLMSIDEDKEDIKIWVCRCVRLNPYFVAGKEKELKKEFPNLWK